MTPVDAIAYAEEIIKIDQMANASYVANGELAKHAKTAAILIDIATQLLAMEDSNRARREALFGAEEEV